MSHFADLPPTPPDPAFSLVAAFAADDFSAKVDLCPGFYRDENANPWVLPCVREAKQLLHEDSTLAHEHLPLSGHPALIAGARRLAFGANQDDLSRVATIQTVSGTGSNHLGARFLSEALAPARKTVWISDPSWINHSEIWLNVSASITRRTYPYFARNTQSLDFEGMKKTLLQEGVAGDVVILHACAHNPTGLDLTPEQWTAVADILRLRGSWKIPRLCLW
ncbi:pyridoxal phosphate-dependent transferase [Macrophomina phaseolina]|uniref:Pyridoxal phosphate-dependent transferase n=1 Tax=Macrophomina phaseolina TaxID=35725 RepID=A0ABQ8GLY7_9PEZI|nr:pyridoxal phosphate-dependent transferase [Macrophomina phaseolina]